MAKHLPSEQLISLLRIGKPVEQWLNHEDKGKYTILKWLRIDKERDSTYSVAYCESFDEGNENFLDIYEFSLLNPDEPYGVIDTFDSLEKVLDFSIRNYNASEEKFVSAGMIQDEYRVFLEGRK